MSIGKGIRIRGLWGKEIEKGKMGERGKGEKMVASSERDREERRHEIILPLWKGGVGGWRSLSLKGIGYLGNKEGQQNYNRETLCLEQIFVCIFKNLFKEFPF